MADIWGPADIEVGAGVDDRAEAEAARVATLRAMGIKPLSAFSSPMMDTLPPSTRKPRSGNPNGNPRPTPRKIARANGLAFYFSDKPCRRFGHRSERRVSSGQCIECANIWVDENRDKRRVTWRAFATKQRAKLVANLS